MARIATSISLVILLACSNLRADLVLTVDASGNAAMQNTGASAIDFDGYTIHCELASGVGCVTPATWTSIEDQVGADAVAVLGLLGAGGLGFAEANPNSKQVSELTLGSGGVLQPGAVLNLGQPIAPSSNLTDLISSGELRWEWTSATLGSTPNGAISPVPEPSSFIFGCILTILLAGRRYGTRRPHFVKT